MNLSPHLSSPARLLSRCALPLVIALGLLVVAAPGLATGDESARGSEQAAWSPELMTTCSITCGSKAVACCSGVSSCTASGSVLTCDGKTTTCSQVSAWNSCENSCDAQFDQCLGGCGGRGNFTCVRNCQHSLVFCSIACGSNPATNTCP